MARTIDNIYQQILVEKNKRLGLTEKLDEIRTDSKLSVMNSICYIVAVAIHGFESILDAFAVEVAMSINSHIVGTPTYYSQKLLEYQKGDSLVVNEDGLSFGYPLVDISKRIITQVSYMESEESGLDNKLILKIAKGTKDALTPILKEDMPKIRAYVDQIKFAGTKIAVISSEGDVLIPRLSVFHDGAETEDVIYTGVEEALKNYMFNMPFDAFVCISDVVEAIKKAPHITDVYIDPTAEPSQGVFIASYNDNGELQPAKRIDRLMRPASGFLKESSGNDSEASVPKFRSSIKLMLEVKK